MTPLLGRVTTRRYEEQRRILAGLSEAQRRRRASRGGKRGGRGRPQAELSDVKRRLSDLVDDVLEGHKDRGDAAVVGQLLNTYIRAVGVELKVREQQEIVERLEELESLLAQQNGGYSRGA
jgi:hypothetical protein